MNPFASPGFAASTAHEPVDSCAWPPTTSTRACAASGRASGWRSTTSAWASRRSTPTWCSCRRCGCSTRRDARQFERTWFGWPDGGQAEFLAPEGYEVAYRTNAVTRHGEHGNALLSRWPLGDVGHHDVSDHRFEQRGLLHVPVRWNGAALHAVVAHFGLIARAAACARCSAWPISSPPRCRPTSCWSWPATSTTGAKSSTRRCARCGLRARASPHGRAAQRARHLPVARAGVRDGPHLHARAGLPLDLGAARHGLGAHVRPPAAAGRAGAGLARPATHGNRADAAMSTRAATKLAAVGVACAAGCRVRRRQPGARCCKAATSCSRPCTRAIAARAPRGLAGDLHLP